MKKIHYGWVISVTAAFVLMVTNGMPLTGFSPYLPFLSDLGYKGSLLSSLVTVRCVSSFITLFFVNSFYRKVSLRSGLSFCCALIGASFLLMSFAKSFSVYVAGVILNGVAYGLGTMVPVSILMTRWFSLDKGTALAISASGSGICAMIFPGIVTSVAGNVSLPAAFRVMALIAFLISILAAVLLRNEPSEKGLSPYGAEAASVAAKPETAAGEPFRGHLLIIFSVAALLLGGFTMASNSHNSVLFTDSGYTKETAALASSLIGFMMIGGKFLFGFSVDRLGALKTTVMFFITLTIGSLFCTICGLSPFFLYAGALLTGLGYPPTSLGIPLWTGELTTKEDYPVLLKRMQTLHALGGILLSSLPGWIFDATGSYRGGYAILTAIVVLIGSLVIYVFKKRK